MLYLRCTQCGHPNAVQSESILFCDKCGRKLSNNFRDWLRLHPGKTFDDFSKIHCITEFDLNREDETEKQSNPRKRNLLIAALWLIAVAVAGYFGVYKIFQSKHPGNTHKSVLTSQWTETPVGGSGLVLSLPFPLRKQEVEVSQFTGSMIDTMEAYSNVAEKGFRVMAIFTRYQSGIETSLDGAVQGVVSEIQKVQGMSDFKWNRTDTTLNSVPAAWVVMSYKLHDFTIHVETLLACSKNKLWQVITQFSDDDENGRAAASRIMESVVIRED